MRKKAVNQVYDVLKAVHDLEKEMKTAPLRFEPAEADDCALHLNEARKQLHQVLDNVYSSDFRNRPAA